MPIPAEILAVERPKSTVVHHSGNKYYVIKRTSKYDNGRRVPVDLGIIGEIINGKFVPRVKNLDGIEVDIKDCGNVILANECSKEIYDELLQVFSPKDSKQIFTYALLKAVYGDITARDMDMYYDTSFVSEFYPNVACSRKVVGEYYELLGRHINSINKFMKNRLDAIDKNAYIIVDGMLKNNNSEINTYSEFSRKSKIKNSQDISLLYAVDYKKKEPLACSVYPGNMLDKTAFADFQKRFDINKGVIIGDKGFELTDQKRKVIAKAAQLKYIIPIKRNSKCIEDYKLLKYDDVLKNKNTSVLCKKVKVNDKLYYYSFLDVYLQGKEGQTFVTNKINKTNNVKDILEYYNKKKDSFGTIIFESNIDLNPEDIYEMYSYRWTIEEVFKYYKTVLDINDVRVQSDMRLYGSEFINFLATNITCRIKNYIEKKGLEKKYSYKQIMICLSKVKKYRDISKPDKWCDATVLAYINKLIDELDIRHFINDV